MLLSSAFKGFTEDEKEDVLAEDQIRVPNLLCMGIISCGGTPKEKAEVFYGILQEGGLQAHTHISASDKDIEPTFKKMGSLCTVDLFKWANEFTGVECPFDDSADSLVSCLEDLREDIFLEAIYGQETKLDNEVWLKKICESGKWIFNSKDLRKAIFKQAEVQYKL